MFFGIYNRKKSHPAFDVLEVQLSQLNEMSEQGLISHVTLNTKGFSRDTILKIRSCTQQLFKRHNEEFSHEIIEKASVLLKTLQKLQTDRRMSLREALIMKDYDQLVDELKKIPAISVVKNPLGN